VKCLAAVVLLVGTAHAGGAPEGRIGAMIGLQRTDRTAWVFGPSLEVTVHDPISIRGEAQLELGDVDAPFGDSNILGGDGPHVNHVMFGPVWRPRDYARYGLALGAEAGVLVMHSVYAVDHFTKKPAVGMFAQAGHALGPLFFAIQIRFDASSSIDMASPEGHDVPTMTGRANFVIELPLDVR